MVSPSTAETTSVACPTGSGGLAAVACVAELVGAAEAVSVAVRADTAVVEAVLT